MKRLAAALLMGCFAPPLAAVAIDPHYHWVRTVVTYLFFATPVLIFPGSLMLVWMCRNHRVAPWHFALTGLGLGLAYVASWPWWTGWTPRTADEDWLGAGVYVGFSVSIWVLLWIAGVWRNPSLTGTKPLSSARTFAGHVLAGMVLLVAAIGVTWAFTAGPLRSAEKAWAQFQDTERDQPLLESQFLDPLITAATNVYPVVIDAIADRNTPLRGYAIHFLGEVRVAAAVPVLRRIALDAAEHPSFRLAALEALCQISSAEAKTLASAHVPIPETDHFGIQHLRDIEAGRCPAFHRRSYIEAILGVTE